MSKTNSVRTLWMHDRLDRWKLGDIEARDQIIQSIIGRLEALARRMLRGYPLVREHVETGDVLQSATMRLLRALEAVRPDSVRDLFNLAAVQVRRELLDLARHFQRNRANRLHGPGNDSDGAMADVAETTGDHSQSSLDEWSRFHQLVESLPAEEREVVGLLFYHRWSQAEVADLFGVTERTVRRWWHSALLRLKDHLRGDLPPV